MNLSSTQVVIDLIVPVFNESNNMVPHIEKMIQTVRQAGYVPHVILVDDGSHDNSWRVIETLSACHEEIEAIRLSRNFGKDNAIFAGLHYARGDATVTIDSDGQHPISMLPEMLAAWREQGQLIVHAVKAQRLNESIGVRLRAKVFNYCMSQLMNTNMQGGSDYKLLDKKVVEILRLHSNTNAVYRFLVSDLGFSGAILPMNTLPSTRPSRWKFTSLFRLATRAIMFHTDVPLKAFVILMLLMIALAIGLLGILLITLIYRNVVSGYSTLLVLGLLNLCITVVGITGVAVYLKGTLDIVTGRSGAIVWQHISTKTEARQ